MSICRANCFEANIPWWKFCGIWSDDQPTLLYKLYAVICLVITLLIYDLLLTINLFYTPLTVEAIVHEVIFYFTAIAATVKALTILLCKKDILYVFKMLNSDMFSGDDKGGKEIIENSKRQYYLSWKWYFFISHTTYFFLIFTPIATHILFKNDLILPICNYNFLSDFIRNKFVYVFYFYQAFGIYFIMTHNINIDSFIAGLMLMAVTQYDLLDYKMKFLKSKDYDNMRDLSDNVIEENLIQDKQTQVLVHYRQLLRFCINIQHIMSVTMFVQISMTSCIICVTICGLLFLPTTDKAYLFFYLITMTVQIFVPCWMGTRLKIRSQDLVMSAYDCEWIPRTEKFKRNLIFFMMRANKPITLTGCKIFHIDIKTYSSIMKMTYSFCTLLRNAQVQQK